MNVSDVATPVLGDTVRTGWRAYVTVLTGLNHKHMPWHTHVNTHPQPGDISLSVTPRWGLGPDKILMQRLQTSWTWQLTVWLSKATNQYSNVASILFTIFRTQRAATLSCCSHQQNTGLMFFLSFRYKQTSSNFIHTLPYEIVNVFLRWNKGWAIIIYHLWWNISYHSKNFDLSLPLWISLTDIK